MTGLCYCTIPERFHAPFVLSNSIFSIASPSKLLFRFIDMHYIIILDESNGSKLTLAIKLNLSNIHPFG